MPRASRAASVAVRYEMRLRPDQLPAHLERAGLAPVWFVSGDEPMQKLEVGDTLREFARAQGIEERVVVDAEARDFKWSALHDATANRSLFASRRLIELRLGARKPSKEGSGVLHELLSRGNGGDVLLMSSARVDSGTRRTKWFAKLRAAIDQAGVIMEVWPLPASRLPGWIQARVQQSGKHIDHDAAELIAQRVEGNLLAARQEIDALCLLVSEEQITADEVMRSVSDSARFDVFSLTEGACAGDIDRTLRVLHGLQAEGVEPMALFGAVMWDFRRLCRIAARYEEGQELAGLFKRFNIWDRQRQAAVRRALQRHSASALRRLLVGAAHIERRIKSSHSRPQSIWDDFSLLLVRLACSQRRATTWLA